jgi:hypothetical protein
MIWFRGPVGGESCCNQLWTRTLSADGALGPAFAVSPTGTDVSGLVEDGIQLVVSGDDSRTFVWERILDQHGNHFQEDVESRSMRRAGALGPVEAVSPVYTSDADRQDEAGDPSGVLLTQVFVAPLSAGAAVAETTQTQRCGRPSCLSPTRNAFLVRNVIGNRVGRVRELVTGTSRNDSGSIPPVPVPSTGQLISGGYAAIAIWEMRIIEEGSAIGTGLKAEGISRRGTLLEGSTPWAAGQIGWYAAATNTTGREVVVGRTKHGLQVRTNR